MSADQGEGPYTTGYGDLIRGVQEELGMDGYQAQAQQKIRTCMQAVPGVSILGVTVEGQEEYGDDNRLHRSTHLAIELGAGSARPTRVFAAFRAALQAAGVTQPNQSGTWAAGDTSITGTLDAGALERLAAMDASTFGAAFRDSLGSAIRPDDRLPQTRLR